MDRAKRDTLVAHVQAMAVPSPEMPLVPAAQFFDGNDDDASIAANLWEHPGVAAFRELVAQVEARPEVQEVFVAITDLMAEDEGSWPYTDTLYVLTSAAPALVRDWFAPVTPDEVDHGYATPDGTPPAGAPGLASGMAPVRVWWD